MACNSKNRFGPLSTPTSNPHRPNPPKLNEKSSSDPRSNRGLIQHGINFPDTEGTNGRQGIHPSGTSLPEASSLVDSFAGVAKVSLAKSVSSETEVWVEANLRDLVKRMKSELLNEVRQEIAKYTYSKGNTYSKDETFNKSELEFTLRIAKAASIQIIESWAMKRIRQSVNIPNTWTDNNMVKHFLENYIAYGVPSCYLEELKNSVEHNPANEIIHLEPDKEEARVLWTSLSSQLNEREKVKYRCLLKFGLGETAIKCKQSCCMYFVTLK